jgi:hypothetical protein
MFPSYYYEHPVELAAILAQGELVGEKVEFLFLHDERNPLTLAFRIRIGAIHPLIPEALKLCETARKCGGSVPAFLLAGGRCDLPNGGDRDNLRVIKITTHCTAAPLSLADGRARNRGVELVRQS